MVLGFILVNISKSFYEACPVTGRGREISKKRRLQHQHRRKKKEMNTEFLATRKKQFYQIAKEGPREEPVKLKSPRNSKRVRILGKIASTPNSRARAAEIEQADLTKEKKIRRYKQ